MRGLTDREAFLLRRCAGPLNPPGGELDISKSDEADLNPQIELGRVTYILAPPIYGPGVVVYNVTALGLLALRLHAAARDG